MVLTTICVFTVAVKPTPMRMSSRTTLPNRKSSNTSL